MEKEEIFCYDDFLEFSVHELKFFLRQRGHTLTGTKRDLAARALVSFEKKEVPKNDSEFQKSIAREYSDMLAKFQLSDPLAITEWVDSITSWPQINLGKIFHYIIENKAFDTDYIGQYKVKKAYSYFKSGFVSQILVFNEGNENKILLKSSVLPSQNVSSAEHIVWILADASGNIITAYCSCTAGLSQCCNHVIAVMYKIEYAVSQGFTRPTCTETKSKFNDRSTKIVKGCRVDDLIIEKHMAEKKPQKQSICSEIKSSFDPRFGNKSKIEKNSFFDGLHEVF